MKAALLDNNVVKNIFEVNDINFTLFKKRGMNIIDADEIGLAIGDYTEDGVIFYRDVPVYDVDTGEQTGTVKTQLNEIDDYEAYYNAISAELEG